MSGAVASRQAVPREAGAERSLGLASDYDSWLIGIWVALLGFGLVMVASASSGIAERTFDNPLHYFWRQLGAAGLGVTVALALVRTPLRVLERSSGVLLITSLALLVLVLVPGLGREVNGSTRWLRLGPLSMQPSELAKLALVVYLGSYLVRHAAHVRTDFLGFVKPVVVVTLFSGLLLAEPDFGATVVLFSTTLGMLFMGGMSVVRFFAWSLVAIAALATLALQSSYRLQRLVTFLDPWSDPFNSGFQLTQALIAFGRGEWFGVGLGSSVQKLFYLPEVHTDFIFAVVAEELGLVGTLVVIALFCLLVWRAFEIGAVAEQLGQRFGAQVAYGIGFLFGIQAFFNMGVNMGVLPTKGLTLPLFSYGLNSMLTSCIAFGLLLRVAYETRHPVRRPARERPHAL